MIDIECAVYYVLIYFVVVLISSSFFPDVFVFDFTVFMECDYQYISVLNGYFVQVSDILIGLFVKWFARVIIRCCLSSEAKVCEHRVHSVIRNVARHFSVASDRKLSPTDTVAIFRLNSKFHCNICTFAIFR